MANIQDPDARGTMIFAWWMACLADAYHAVYYRRKPMLYVISSIFDARCLIILTTRDDDDYDIDFYTADPVMQEVVETQTPKPSPREQLEFLVKCSITYLKTTLTSYRGITAPHML
jgi:hypothetical protein